LEEALQIIKPMLNGEKVSFSGKHYSVTDAVNSPEPISQIPIMIGGSGEKKTLRMVAQYANESNLSRGTAQEIPQKLDALAAHCERLGRNRAEIKVTKLVMCCVAPTMEEAQADVKALSGAKNWTDEVMQMLPHMLIFGDPDTVGEKLQELMSTGIDGLTINLPVNGHNTDRIRLLGQVANAAIG
jgi:alkanesulfonate monooxygenase SsuD/methylene tetrahydromethanopterin reductase-like flavin-dependent oxidoreductase (luciferase family)